jgi:hypothetical protein
VRRIAAVIAAVLAALAAGCAADIGQLAPDGGGGPVGGGDAAAPPDVVEVVDNGDGTSTVRVNATDPTRWIYLDLGELARIETDDPAASADWDLGLQRFHLLLDGGVSGAGQGALVVFDGAELADVTSAPADGWVTDAADDPADEDDLPELAFETAEGGWFDYDDATHVLTPKARVYAVRGAGGDAYALRIDGYYNDAGTAAWPEFTVAPLPAAAAAR